MPCFKGLAVSIHTPDGPLAEHSIQRLGRQSRITSYISVPPPKLNGETVEPSTFAISITLLTPGLAVPYSAPKPTPENPYPQPQIVGGLPGYLGERGKYGSTVAPYVPFMSTPNETIAAYIYFDGRAKEEVATLLRRGEETWVNSRWVSVPESEGGGLAEREFLFREVGLERWLNGLDLEGEQKEVAAILEKRKQRLEKKRKKKVEVKDESDDEDADGFLRRTKPAERNRVLRYGDNDEAPVESLSADEGEDSSDFSSDDEPMPESSGQIKVCLFRVLASGEIKRGEYSPQFDAHDDDEGMEGAGGAGGSADVDHTTSFAKPKTLDPKTISTQTVTGLDPSERPYATFTFLYRGEKQLQKMGILPSAQAPEQRPQTTRRKSKTTDFSNLPPLKPKSAAGFTGYRETAKADAKGNGKVQPGPDDMDSDNEANESGRANGMHDEDGDTTVDDKSTILSAEETARRGELAEGVKKLQLKRQHSAENVAPDSARKQSTKPAEAGGGSDAKPVETAKEQSTPSPTDTSAKTKLEDAFDIGSPFKKHRASIPATFGGGGETKLDVGGPLPGLDATASSSLPQPKSDTPAPTSTSTTAPAGKDEDGDEEL